MNKCSCGFRIGHPEFSKCICKIPKPLSDEEIKDIKEHLPPALSKPELLMLFARAIEERHGIK
jgi:hypothetical protein